MKLTTDILLGFSETFLKWRYDEPKPTPEFHLELWDLFLKPHKYVAAAAPRGHAKSTAVTHAFVLACNMFRIKDYTIIVSDTEDQAKQFLGDIKRELLENEELISIFEISKFIKDKEDDIIVECRDGHQFRITAYGSTQKLRGRKWRGKRPNLIIGDDMENDELVMNDDRRKKARNWFQNSLFPMGSDSCWIRIVGTVLHLDSLLARIVPLPGEDDVIETPLRVRLPDGKTKGGWHSKLWRSHPDIGDFSEILWPEKFTKERLLVEYHMYEQDGNTEGYAQEYLNNPIDTSKSFYRDKDFIPIHEQDKDDYEEYYITADLAISEAKKSAFTCIGVAGLARNGQIRMRDVERFRGDTMEIIDRLIDTFERWHRRGGGVQLVGIEEENISKAIGPVLIERCDADGVTIPERLVQLKPNKDKIQRSRSSQYLMRRNRFEFDVEASWFPTFKKELIYFDRATYKDQIDMFAWMGQIIREMAKIPTEESEERESYRDEIYESYNFYDTQSETEREEEDSYYFDFHNIASSGRSKWTGY
jgi:phage terminase large subunit-like protein